MTRKSLTPKKLHDLRIACRRAEAALRLCGEFSKSQSSSWLRNRLRDVRRVSNAVRDDDTLLKRLKRQPEEREITRELSRVIAGHRRDVVPRIVERVEAAAHGRRFERRTQRVLRLLAEEERSQTIPSAFGKRLFSDLERFVQAVPTQTRDAQSLHRLRIESKRLRYSVELITEIWPDVDLTELRELLTTLQERLGQLHDEFVQEQRRAELLTQLPRRLRRSPPIESERRRNQRERAVWKWWQKRPLERILADATAEIVTLIRK